MKRVTEELVYPGTTVQEVADLLADPAFREAVADDQRAIARKATVTQEGDGRRVLVEYTHGAHRIPSFARRFVGAEIPIRQEEHWSARHDARIEVTIPGKPGDMSGTASLEQRGEDVVEHVEMSVRVGIPLVGGKVEDLVAGLLEKALHAENRLGVSWLRQR